MTEARISAFPPKGSQNKAIDKFISGANDKNSHTIQGHNNTAQEAIVQPWEATTVRSDIKIPYTMQLPEPYVLKLRYISTKTNKSQQTILREIIMPKLDKLIHDLSENG